MQVTVNAKCWDGARSKSLLSVPLLVGTEVLPQIEHARVRFDPKINALLSFAVPVMLLTGLSPVFAAAAPVAVPVMAADTKAKIIHALDPLINLIISLSYPIAGVMIAGGCLMIMIGSRERGMQILQNAAIGYILVQLTPMMLNLLVGIGGSV
jgi:hypothetical protein